MRDLGAAIDAQLAAGGLTTIARCVAVQLRDGTVIALSDHDELLVRTVSTLGQIFVRPDSGILVGDIQLSTSLTSGNTEMTCPLGSLVTRSQVNGRRFNAATVWIFDTDWSTDSDEIAPLMKGTIGEAQAQEGVAVFQIRDLNDHWNVSIGGILTPRCRADFGDAQCGKERTEVAATVTAVASTIKFTTNLTSYADQFFRFGDCEFTSGDLDGVWPFEIVDFAAGQIELLAPLPNFPAIGDELLVRNGCSRLKSSADPSLPTCLFYNNVLRFRGFDQVPGSDTFIKVAVPGN